MRKQQVRKWCFSFTVLVVLFLFCGQSFAASATTQVDALIKKLIEKGILTEDEASAIKDEIVYDEKEIRDSNMKKDIPEWVQNTKLKGDFRVRHEFSRRQDNADRNRGRIRYRLGVESNINDKVTVGVGLASNGGNGTSSSGAATTDFSPRSNNSSFQNAFSKQAIVLNYAYAQYRPNQDWTLTGGKILNPIWEPWEFLWDNDITPEGGAIRFDKKLSDKISLFGLATAFQISEISTNQADPFMYVLQGGLQGNLTEKLDYKLAGTWYGTDNIYKTLLSNRSGTNTLDTANGNSNRYAYHYDTSTVGIDVGLNDPFGEKLPFYIPRIGMIGEYDYNAGAPSDINKAWMYGAYIGNSKVSGWGTWKITGARKVIGKDAFLDAFPDSDFYSGSTDIKGYETLFELGIAKNVSVAVDYYRGERIKASKAQESVLQTDINFKF